ncbi:MAG: outer membrane protein assembly factor BamE domain-containing protein [Desulfuromonadales bacterium]
MRKTINILTTLLVVAALGLPLTGCMPSMGRPFPVQQVRKIEIGKTTQAEIRQMFGDPWRTGIEDGKRTWTYGEYSTGYTRDLVIRFDDRNVVRSYSFSSSLPEDENL